MIFTIYLLCGGGDLNNFLKDAGLIILFLGIFELIVYIAPLVISFHVEKIHQQNKELKSELSEIKNLLIYQNDLIKNQQSPYNPYYQQQQYSQQYNHQQNNTFNQ